MVYLLRRSIYAALHSSGSPRAPIETIHTSHLAALPQARRDRTLWMYEISMGMTITAHGSQDPVLWW